MTNTQAATEQRAMIIVPLELMERIDRNRDRMSRAEFIEFCIDTLLQQGEGRAAPAADTPTPQGEPQSSPEAVSRQEFEEFKQRMKRLQQIFIESMLTWGLEPLKTAPPQEQERFKEEVARLLQISASGPGAESNNGE